MRQRKKNVDEEILLSFTTIDVQNVILDQQLANTILKEKDK